MKEMPASENLAEKNCRSINLNFFLNDNFKNVSLTGQPVPYAAVTKVNPVVSCGFIYFKMTFNLCFQVQDCTLFALPSGQLAGHVHQSQLRCGQRLHAEGPRGGGPAEAAGLHRDWGEHQVGARAALPRDDATQPHSSPDCQQQELCGEDQEAVHRWNSNPDHWRWMHNLYLVQL